MNILALETSDKSCSVAALHSGKLLAEHAPENLRSAQALASTIELVLSQAHWQTSEIELIAVTTGPGSFTGLRVGVTTAKVLGYSLGTPVLGVNTLHAIALQAVPQLLASAQQQNTPTKIVAVIDAQRQELFSQTFELQAGSLQPCGEPEILPVTAWLTQLTPETLVTGPGLKKAQASLPEGTTALPPELWQPQACTVGQLANELYQQGQRSDIWSLAPLYLRRSAAEEKADGPAAEH